MELKALRGALYKPGETHQFHGGNCFVLQKDGWALLIDCGKFPTEQSPEEQDFSYLEGKKLVVLITHGHNDHIGNLPALISKFPQVIAVMTRPTYEIGKWVWNSGPVESRRMPPSDGNFKIINSEAEFSVGPFKVRTAPNGHIIGSISLAIFVEGKKIFFSGDFSFLSSNTRVAEKTSFRNGLVKLAMGSDLALIDSTNTGKDVLPAREGEEKRLIADIRRTFERKGKALIAASVIRTPEILAMIYRNGINNIYTGRSGWIMNGLYGQFINPDLLVPCSAVKMLPSMADWWKTQELLKSNLPAAMVVSSGSFYGGESVYYTKELLVKSENLIGVSGWQNPASPGYDLLTNRGKIINFLGRWVDTARGAKIAEYQFSTHPSKKEIVGYLNEIRSKKVLLIHGDEKSMDELKDSYPAAEKMFIEESYSL